MTTKTLKYDLPIGAKFVDSAGDCWQVTATACRVGRGYRSRIDESAFLADCLTNGCRGCAWTKATGKRFQRDERIKIVSDAETEARLAEILAEREARDRASQEEQEREEREWREHEATPLHQLADQISSIKGTDWGWCLAWESLGMDLLRQIELRLKEIGKL